jgi:hypothetical protein
MVDDRNARIREQAYRLWQQEGEPHGRDREHWEEAERAFAGEGPVADDVDPQIDADAGAAAPAVGADTADQPVETPPPPPQPAAAAGKSPAAKKPAARRKRTA